MIAHNSDSLVFRIKLSKQEVEQNLIRILQQEGLINGNEEKYFTEMQLKGKSFLFEFVVPVKDTEQKSS